MTIRISPAISRSSAMAAATAARVIAICRRRSRAITTGGREAITPRATIASTSPNARAGSCESADSLQITLLVIGVDYQEESDLLKLEGVSLNFLD